MVSQALCVGAAPARGGGPRLTFQSLARAKQIGVSNEEGSVSRDQAPAAERQSEQAKETKSKEVFKDTRPAKTASVRAKPHRHKKVTADKWNQ